MNLITNISIALENIKANKMRSLLTMLGIIIGISSVITIVALGNGGKAMILGQFEKIGSNTVQLSVDPAKASTDDYITEADIEYIKETVPTVKYVTPSVQKQGKISSEKNSRMAIVVGGTEDLSLTNNDELLGGRFINRNDYEEGKPVVILEDAGAKTLFGTTNAIGRKVQIGSVNSMVTATVIGVVKSYTGMMGGEENTNIPVIVRTTTTFLEKLFPNEFVIDKVYIVSFNKENNESIAKIVENIIQNRHGNRNREVYKIENMMKQLDQINNIFNILTAFISAVAAISLLVGGIGVMNIMLVSVTERTREIGIRKSIGATTRIILMQFLIEAVILSGIGGLLGVISGILLAQLIGFFANIDPVLSLGSILVALLFSSMVGVFFGIYPARKAARLDPIEALRYE